MGLYFYKDFLLDLKSEGDSKFPRRVLSKVLDSQGAFPHNPDDHRYGGIDDAWIRYVSQGGAAFRVIYIRKGADIYLYRAGPHSVENNLSPPAASAVLIPVVTTSEELVKQVDALSEAQAAKNKSGGNLGRFLENYRPEYINKRLLSRRFLKHKEVILVSPYLSPELFSVYSPFGKVLYDLLHEGTKLTLITSTPTALADLKFFERLEAEGFDVLFHERLHAKLYLFDVEPSMYSSQEEAQLRRVAILGSANLTIDGIAIGATEANVVPPNEELAYELPIGQFDAAFEYATYLTVSATDVLKERVRLARLKR